MSGIKPGCPRYSLIRTSVRCANCRHWTKRAAWLTFTRPETHRQLSGFVCPRCLRHLTPNKPA